MWADSTMEGVVFAPDPPAAVKRIQSETVVPHAANKVLTQVAPAHCPAPVLLCNLCVWQVDVRLQALVVRALEQDKGIGMPLEVVPCSLLPPAAEPLRSLARWCCAAWQCTWRCSPRACM